jgi:hypothetical protein
MYRSKRILKQIADRKREDRVNARPQGFKELMHLMMELSEQGEYELVLYPPDPNKPSDRDRCWLEAINQEKKPVNLLKYLGFGVTYQSGRFIGPDEGFEVEKITITWK